MAVTGLVGRSSEAASVSEEVISAVAAASGRDPTDLDPLFEVIDPDALDALYDRDGYERAKSPDRLEFTYCGCEVVVGGDGSITVAGATGDAS